MWGWYSERAAVERRATQYSIARLGEEWTTCVTRYFFVAPAHVSTPIYPMRTQGIPAVSLGSKIEVEAEMEILGLSLLEQPLMPH